MEDFKVIHVSDTHGGLHKYGVENPETGINSRAQDLYKSLNYMVDYAIENKIKLIIHSGDVFDTKHPSLVDLNALSAIIKRAADNGIFIYILLGNHDISRNLTRKSPVDHFTTLHVKNVHVTRGGEYLDLGYCQIVSVPYWATPEDIVQQIEGLAEKVDFKRPAILVAHLQIDYIGFPGWFSDPLPFVPSEALGTKPWTYVAVGHIHKNQKLLKDVHAYYAGSLVRCSFNEENEPKGFMEFEVKGNKAINVHLHEVDCLRMLTFKGTMTEVRSKLEDIMPENLENYIIRCIIEETDEPIDDAYIKSKLNKSFKYVVTKKKTKLILPKLTVANGMQMYDFINAYFEKEPEKEELLKLIEELKSEAQ